MKSLFISLSNPRYVAIIAIFTCVVIIISLLSNKVVLPRVYNLAMNLPVVTVYPLDKGSDISALEKINNPDYQYKIKLGDNLLSIFSKLHLRNKDKKALFKSDKENKLSQLKIGDIIRVWLAKNGKNIRQVEIEFSPERKTQFVRNDKGRFNVNEIKIKGKWKQEVVSGFVKGNFSLAAYRAGLTFAEIDDVSHLLRHQINLARELREGDQFSVIRSALFVDGEPTGKSEIEAIRIQASDKLISAYLHTNGNYYDEQGKPIARTFLRYPTKKKIKVSSPYNLNRKHPITKRSMPHKGTDFYAYTGTKVIATADGVVKVARSHVKAGNFIVLDHGDQFITRYLHNSKLLVKKGEQVKRGQLIALSGSTGRVTGPHIHYELWVEGRAVNGMKAILPQHTPVPKKQQPLYARLVKKYNQIMGLTGEGGILVGDFNPLYRASTLAMQEKIQQGK